LRDGDDPKVDVEDGEADADRHRLREQEPDTDVDAVESGVTDDVDVRDALDIIDTACVADASGEKKRAVTDTVAHDVSLSHIDDCGRLEARDVRDPSARSRTSRGVLVDGLDGNALALGLTLSHDAEGDGEAHDREGRGDLVGMARSEGLCVPDETAEGQLDVGDKDIEGDAEDSELLLAESEDRLDDVDDALRQEDADTEGELVLDLLPKEPVDEGVLVELALLHAEFDAVDVLLLVCVGLAVVVPEEEGDPDSEWDAMTVADTEKVREEEAQ
jgi:hypothetical protein